MGNHAPDRALRKMRHLLRVAQPNFAGPREIAGTTALALAVVVLGLNVGCCLSRPKRSETVTPVLQIAPLAASRAVAEAKGLDAPAFVESVNASCPVPAGWAAEPLKQGSNYKHQIWISPSGHTAYGVLFISLPFPAALFSVSFRVETVLERFLEEMKKREGRADLVQRADDPDSGGIRFVAEGGLYRVHSNLLVHGLRAWFVYAGTRQNLSLVPGEFSLAERARDQTRVGENQ
jgi:hypothetical protein